MTLLELEPCALCNKTPRGDVFGLCIDCADLEHVSEFFLVADPEAYEQRIEKLILQGYVKRKDYEVWRKIKDERIAKATPEEIRGLDTLRKTLMASIGKEGDYYIWRCPYKDCGEKVRTRSRKAIDEVTAKHINLHRGALA